jgi:hypothetical protein
VIDAEGIVRAGNGTLEAARAAGIEEALVIETDGRQLVVVRRPDWSAEQALAYAIADNRTGELSRFNYEALGAALASLTALDIPIVGFDQGELDMLLAADWRPQQQVPVESYTRAEPASEALILTVEPEHAQEIGEALRIEREAGAGSESEALLSIVRRARV